MVLFSTFNLKFKLSFLCSDAFFTEKHLGQARDKKYWTKYDDSSLKKASENIPSKILYLVHQPGDLTHLEQSMILSRALVDKGILFKQQVKINHPFAPHLLISVCLFSDLFREGE